MRNDRDVLRADGMVVDAGGRPVVGAVVRMVRPLLRGETVLAETRTEAGGRFALFAARPAGMPVTARIQLEAVPARGGRPGGGPGGGHGGGQGPAEPGPGQDKPKSPGFLSWLLGLLLALLRLILARGPGRRGGKVREPGRRPGAGGGSAGAGGSAGVPAEGASADGDPAGAVRSPLLLPEEAGDVVLRFGPPAEDEYSALLMLLRPLLGGVRVGELEEAPERRDLTFLAGEMGVPAELLMQLVLAERAAHDTNLPAAVFYAFFRSGVPASLPTPLLEASDEFRLIQPLTAQVARLVVAVDDAQARQTLEAAVARRLVPRALTSSLDAVLERLRVLREAQQLDAPVDAGAAPLRRLLEVAGLNDARQRVFLEVLRQRGADIADFWRSLGPEDPDLEPGEVEALRRTFELGSLVRYHVPAIRPLEDELAQRPTGLVAELAWLELADWARIVDAAGPPAVPPDFVAPEGEDVTTAFAREVHHTVQRQYPTTALAARVERDGLLPDSLQGAVNRFFHNVPGLDLTELNLGAWLEQNGPQAFDGIDDGARPAVEAQVLRIQRVLRITEDPRAGAVLLATQLDSGARIHTLGETQVVRRLEAAGVPVLQAQRVFQNGVARYGNSLALLSRFNVQLRGIYPSATGPGAPFGDVVDSAIVRNPSLANLFGSQDMCAVDPCTSVLSPASYLTDLLLWLRARGFEDADREPAEWTALDVLAARRPDILHLKLDCPNSFTPLPYIDLVNELLEDAVSPPDSSVWRQTTRSAAELRAAPEHVNDGAYEVLAEAVFPYHLPYDRAFDELSAVLARGDVALWQVREARVPLGSYPSDAEATAIASARFGMGHAERDLVVEPGHRPLAEVWGSPDPVADLAVVADFLQATGLDYDGLLQLLACRWPRGGHPALGIADRNNGCDTTAQRLTGLTTRVLDRIHRFLRLWRRTGWAMWELDLALLAFGSDDGSLDAALRALFDADQVRTATRLPTERVLSFWGDVSTASYRLPGGTTQPSLYQRIFQDPLLPPADALRLEQLEAPGAPQPLADHLDAVRAALGLSTDEATTLAAWTSGELTLGTLSAIHRSVVLARALRISLEDAAWLAGGDLADAFASPAATRAFIARTREVQRVGTATAAVRYALTGGAAGGRSDTELADILRRVRLALQQVHDDIHTGEPSAAVLARQLATLPWLRRDTLPTAVAIVAGTFEGSDGERNAFVAEHFAPFMDVAAAQALLTPPAGWDAMADGAREAVVAERASRMLEALEAWLTRERVVAAVAAGFGLSDPLAERLLSDVPLPADPPLPEPERLLAVLSDPALFARDADGAYQHELSYADLPKPFTALRLLDRMAVVVRGLRLSRAELTWLLEHGGAIGGVVLQELPVLDTQPDQGLDPWLATARFLLLERTFTATAGGAAADGGGPVSLGELMAGVLDGSLAAEADIHEALARIAGWRTEDAADAADALGVAGTAWREVDAYDRIRRVLAMAVAAGAGAGRLLAWGGPDPAPAAAHAEEAWRALQSRYSREEWLAAAPDVMDPLRIRRRDALTWYLLGHGAGADRRFHDTADLFSHFLIDTEMSPCQVTTRVIQAYAAVQLFVQRALMNLEREVPADLATDSAWAEWKWMSRYRVWEAARKVFLWPENWLMEPHRPSRSELFDGLDREVHQRDSTPDSMETATLAYLDGLDEVARLHVTGLCTDPATDDLYVVARSTGDPGSFFIRTFANRKWSPWARVPHDIASWNAVPAFYAGRLHLFWLQVFVHAEERQRLDPVDPSRPRDTEPPERYVELRVFASSLRDGAWTAPQGAAGSLYDKPPRSAWSGGTTGTDPESLYTVRTSLIGSRLHVDVYRRGVSAQAEVAPLEERIGGGLLAIFFGYSLEALESDVSALMMLLNSGRHLGRAVFSGRFDELQLRNPNIDARVGERRLRARARELYGPRAADLNPVPTPPRELAILDGFLAPEPGTRVERGGLVARSPSGVPMPLRFELGMNLGTLLGTVPTPFRVMGRATDVPLNPRAPFVLMEPRRSWFMERRRITRFITIRLPGTRLEVQVPYITELHGMQRFDHPFVRTFRHVLASSGFDAFFRPALQRDPRAVLAEPDPFHLPSVYAPNATRVQWSDDRDRVEFEYEAPYGIYNWELFYHLPLFIAGKLSLDQRFDEARRWFHYVFDPTRASDEPAPQRFWITRPLADLTVPSIQAQQVHRLLDLVNQGDEAAVRQVRDWRRDPFNPFLLAEHRPVAYMKRVVMSYLDNLIAWGDALFATASREALNEATQLYVLASELLGPRPYLVTPPPRAARSWTELEPELDAFANAVVTVENLVPGGADGAGGMGGAGAGGDGAPLPRAETFYFRIPPNEKLLGYWDTVEDRLFKLRHCLGLGGEALALPLFDAPIDPAILVRARAAGLDLGAILLDLGAPMPSYRFTELHRRAVDYTEAVQELGQKLLVAIEARDTEALAMLLVTQRRRIHAETRQILEWEAGEAEAEHDAVVVAIELAQYQYDAAAAEPFMSALEATAVTMKSILVAQKLAGMVKYLVAGGLAAIPDFMLGAAGVGGSPQSSASTGGSSASSAAEKGAEAAEKFNQSLEKGADLIKMFAKAEKRAKKAKHAKEEAAHRRREAEAQREAAHLRRLMAERRLELHDRTAEDLDAEREFLRLKFGNEAMYDWMVGQLSSLYFSAYRLATGMARRAERCYRFELGLTDSSIIGSGGWDSLRRGLLAGESLGNDLRRLESSYLELNVRRREITRTISLRSEFPTQLLSLLVTGECSLDLDEVLFDRDYPGHYQRRITRASITVERPDARTDDNVVCTATLLRNTVRLLPTIGDGYERRPAPEADPRFADNFAALQGMVTGNAMDDPGLFVRDITDNLEDPRYLPFENAGLIGEWHIELPAARNALDLSTVSDVKLHLHYTALDGGSGLRGAAEAAVEAEAPDHVDVAFDARGEFPEAWARFMAPAGGGEQRFVLPLRPGLLPPVARGRSPRIARCQVHLLHDDPGLEFQVSLLPPAPVGGDAIAGGVVSHREFDISPALPLQPLTVRVRERGVADWASLPPDRLSGMIIAVRLELS
jgi:hypothetical protein